MTGKKNPNLGDKLRQEREGAENIILDLVEGAVLDHGQRVFLAFNGALLKAGEHLG